MWGTETEVANASVFYLIWFQKRVLPENRQRGIFCSRIIFQSGCRATVTLLAVVIPLEPQFTIELLTVFSNFAKWAIYHFKS